MPDAGERAILERAADHDCRQPQPDELLDARVVFAQVDHQHAVDAPLGPPAAVDSTLLVDVLDDLDRQRDRARRELRLDAGDELHEERLERERRQRAREHEPAGVGARGRERARGAVRVPAELLGDREDPLACAVGDARDAR